MYDAAKILLLRILCVPEEPLDPMGDVAQLKVFRAAPGYFKYLKLMWYISQAFLVLVFAGIEIAIVAACVNSRIPPLGLAAAVLLFLLVLLLWILQAWVTYSLLRLNYDLRWYKTTDRSLRLREGVWNVHELTLTFANIQNITVTQGPLERLFGIANVRVETAGGGGVTVGSHGEKIRSDSHTAVFRGVDNAREIRDLMMTHLRKIKGAGLGDSEDLHTTKQTGVVAFDGEYRQLLTALRDEAAALRHAAQACRSSN